MRIFNPINTAATKHHLILGQRPRLVREQVLDLTQVLCDVESPALDPAVQLVVVQVHVIVDEVDLTQFYNLNRDVQRNGDEHLLKEIRCDDGQKLKL